MKKELTKVSQEKFRSVIHDEKVFFEEMTGYIKVEINGRRCYVAKTQNVSRVDVAFAPDVKLEGVNELDKDLKFGRVSHELDFTLDEASILKNFRGLIRWMKTAPEPAKAAKKEKKAKKKASAPVPEPATAGPAEGQPVDGGSPVEEKDAPAPAEKPPEAKAETKEPEAPKVEIPF